MNVLRSGFNALRRSSPFSGAGLFTRGLAGGGLPVAPDGFVLLLGADGACLTGADGAYLVGVA